MLALQIEFIQFKVEMYRSEVNAIKLLYKKNPTKNHNKKLFECYKQKKVRKNHFTKKSGPCKNIFLCPML